MNDAISIINSLKQWPSDKKIYGLENISKILFDTKPYVKPTSSEQLASHSSRHWIDSNKLPKDLIKKDFDLINNYTGKTYPFGVCYVIIKDVINYYEKKYGKVPALTKQTSRPNVKWQYPIVCQQKYISSSNYCLTVNMFEDILELHQSGKRVLIERICGNTKKTIVFHPENAKLECAKNGTKYYRVSVSQEEVQ